MKRLALYLRLSLEDEGEKDESNSISNQRKLIYEYIHHDSELSGYEAVEFSDDGFSGANMNRPGMQKLLKEVKANNIICIIVKDDCVIIEPTQKDLENQGFVAGSICF